MTAYIHIGMHKTGTTSIQTFLEANRKFLLNQKIYCPRSCTMWNRVQHRMLKFILEEYLHTNINNENIIQNIKTVKFIQELKNLKKEIAENSDNIFLFSDEGFSWWFTSKQKIQLIKQFFKELGFNKIILIIYLRDFQDFFNSLASEDIKNNNLIFKTNLIANENPDINSYNYSYICQNYSEVFGKENLIVRLFDKNEFYNEELLKDFIHAINLKWDANFILPCRQNERLDLIGFELRRRLNNILPQSDTWLFDRIDNFFKSTNHHLNFKSKKNIIQSYLYHLKESNEWIRKEFFPHKERLFSKKFLAHYKENYELKRMKPEYWDKIADFIADITITKNRAIQNKDNQIADVINEKQKAINKMLNLQNQINKLQNTLNSLSIRKQQLEISNLEQDLINKKLQAQQLEKQLNTVATDNKLTVINLSSAKTIIQNQLPYKLGQAMILNSKSLLGYIRMPFVLSYIKDKHKQEQKTYQEKIKKDPSLKLPPLEDYPDYKEALKEKECLTYKLGQILIKADQEWYKGGYVKMWLEIRKLKQKFKKKEGV